MPIMQTFRKSRAGVPSDFFASEAAGLRWLDATGAVRTPTVLDVGPGFIEMERLPSASPTQAAAADFGRALARLHDAGAPSFGCGPDGWVGDGYIGDATLPLRPEPTWGAFYARWRVEPYLASSGLSRDDRRVFDELCEALEAGRFDDGAPPARLHGDLWSGNVAFTPEGVALIDPAAHGGHRVTDLAMLALFGCPELPTILDAYAAASPWLPATWRPLVGLHQVHPLLVHATLFGGGYGASAARAARSALSLH